MMVLMAMIWLTPGWLFIVHEHEHEKQPEKTIRRSGRSAVRNFRNHFGGHSVMVA